MKAARFVIAPLAIVAFSIAVLISGAATREGTSPSLPAVSPQPSADEKMLFDLANHERAAVRLQPLHWDDALAAAAHKHAEWMVREQLLSHQYPHEPSLLERASSAGAKFSMLAENIALGPDVETIHRGWMHSPPHRKNILNPALNAVGIAVTKGSLGLYAAQDFSAQITGMSLEQQEQRVVSLLAASGLRGAKVTKDARERCRTKGGYVGFQAGYIFRFESADLGKLPDQLVGEIKRARYRTASVGACSNDEKSRFAFYRLAVVLQ